jgi:hypothetical protein
LLDWPAASAPSATSPVVLTDALDRTTDALATVASAAGLSVALALLSPRRGFEPGAPRTAARHDVPGRVA